MEFSQVLLLSLALLGFLWWKISRPKSFPPGPLALPIIGNLLQINFSNPLKDIKEFSKVYGPVYSLQLGFVPAVVVRGIKDLKEVLVTRGNEFADRPQNRLTKLLSGTRGLIASPYGRGWKEHRRFTLSTLRNFGLGKNSMEERISEESVHLIQYMKQNKDNLVDPHFVIDNAVSNIICSIVFGRRYDYDDSTFRDILNLVHENMKMASSFWAQLYNAFGFVHYLPLPHRRIIRNVDVVFGFLERILEEHKRTRTPGVSRDYIDCYLEELDKEQEVENGKKVFDHENLFTCVSDLFVAGTESTSSSLEWGLLYMMAFPDIQEKCLKEIDKIHGDRGRLNYEDRVYMPYTQAFLHEVQRYSSIVPLGVLHGTTKDVQLNGFTIPKGTTIITDLSSLHFDETYWKYPNEFNPENFLSEDGELLKQESFLPFSAGKWNQNKTQRKQQNVLYEGSASPNRLNVIMEHSLHRPTPRPLLEELLDPGPRSCLGENLARMEIFLFFTALLTHFEVHWPDPKSTPDLTPVFGISQAPKRYKMRLVPRR